MKITGNIRWGKVVTWGLLTVAGLGVALVAVVLFPAWYPAHAREAGAVQTPPEPAARVQRVDTDTLLLPGEVLRALDLRTVKAVTAKQSRSLPPLIGCLALDSNELVRVHTRFAGEVVSLGKTNGRPIRYGDEVKKGQLLAVVWSKDLGEKKSELVDALSKLRIDRTTLERMRELYREAATPERSLRDAERTVESDLISVARAERTLLSWRLDDDEIKAVRAEAEQLRSNQNSKDTGHADWAQVKVCSPQDGVLLEKNIVVGDMVDTSADLFKIANLKKLAVWVHVYEEDLAALQRLPKPTHWTIRLPSHPEVYEGTIDQIGAVIDPNQHTALVTGSIDNSKGTLLIGQFVTATIDVAATGEEVEVPTTALVEDGRESIVFVQPDPQKPRFERRKVQVVRRFQDIVHLTSTTIRSGERVVTGGAVLLNEAIDDLPIKP